MVESTMFLTTGMWTDMGNDGGYKSLPTFMAIALTNDSPFIECIFHPEKQILLGLTKHREDTFKMLPKLDPSGYPLVRKMLPEEKKESETNYNPYKQERVQTTQYYETVIRDKEDICDFLKVMTINYNEDKITKFFV